MKHSPSWTVVILLCLLLVAGAAVLVLTPRTVPFDECSPLYRQYAGQEGIKASYVRDYPVDDTTLVDVTLLRATTDSAWISLCHEFLPNISNIINNLPQEHAVTFWAVSKDNHRTQVTPNTIEIFDLVLLTAQMKTIYVFHLKDKEQSSVIFDIMTSYILHINNNQNSLP